MLIDAVGAAVLAHHGLEHAGAEHPAHQFPAALAERVFQALLGAGGEAVDRD
jgi:hypothetical protein